MSAQNIQRLFSLQKSNLTLLKERSYEERIAQLNKLKRVLLEHRNDIVKAGAADFNKPETEVDLAEIVPILSEIAHTKKHLKKWMKARKVKTPLAMLGTRAYVHYEPKGTSLIIAPWNYPVYLSFGPLVSAIAAGCSSIIKPSEMTPHMSKIIAKITKACFAEHEVAVVEGAVEETTELLSLPFDHIFFTGSPAVGKIVMSAAAKHLTSVTLELGGKSPVIVDSSAHIDKAVSKIVWGKFTNNGQTCIAPDYVYVANSILAEFKSKLTEKLDAVYGKTNQQKTPDLARIVNERHFARVNSLLDDARERGDVFYGGQVDPEDNFISPTLVAAPSLDSEIMNEEIFGPLLPILGFDDVDEVLTTINSKPKPLALYVFTENESFSKHIINNTSAGGSCINTCLLHFLHEELPSGGVNNSGIGKAHGHEGFLAFSNERGVVKDNWAMTKMMFPPYTPKVKKAVAMTIKFLSR